MQEAGFEVDLSASIGTDGAPFSFDGLRVWPGVGMSGESLCVNLRRVFGEQGGPAVVFTDAVRLFGQVPAGLDLAYWLPFETRPPSPQLVELLSTAVRHVMVPTRWAAAELDRCGLPSVYLPMGIDTGLFRPPTAAERAEARRRNGLDERAFVVGMVATNVEHVVNRKSLPEAIEGFARFQDSCPDAVLLLHTRLSNRDGGFDLAAICSSVGTRSGSVHATSDDRVGNLSSEEMVERYWCMDVLLAPSAGESFCVPLVEAQACGVPVVASNFSAQAELVGAGWLVDGQERWAPFAEGWLFTPSVSAISEALSEAYRCAGDVAISLRAAAFAGGFDHVVLFRDRWLPFLRSWIGAETLDR